MVKEYGYYLIIGDEALYSKELTQAWYEFLDNRNEFTVSEVRYAKEHFLNLFRDRFDLDLENV